MFTSSMRTIVLATVAVTLAGVVTAHNAHAAHKEVVTYRLVKQKTIHLDDMKAAQGYHKTLSDLGCESKLNGHTGHFDLTYRCPNWREVELDNHDSAHKWEKWLKSLGFETGHNH
jgi:hypothetical protein